jgi:ABC-2 type transport system permease protein
MRRFLSGVWLVGRREFLAYVQAWGFWVSLITTPLLLGALLFAPALLRKAEPTRLITIISDTAEPGEAIERAFHKEERADLRAAIATYAQRNAPQAERAALDAFDVQYDREEAIAAAREALGAAGGGLRPPAEHYRLVDPPSADPEALRPYLAGEQRIGGAPLFAAFIVRGEGERLRLDYWSTNLTDGAPMEIARSALSELMRRTAMVKRGLGADEAARVDAMAPLFSQFDPRARPGVAVTAADRAPFVAAAGLTLLLWSAVIGAANMLLSGVIEEKSNKILDALLTAVTPLQILTGKLLGVGAVSATLFAVWAVFALAGLPALAGSAAGAGALAIASAAFSPPLALMFLICFVAGYLLYGAIFLGLGALCESLQESQSLMTPVFLVMTIPVLLLGPAFANPNAPIVVAASWAPLFSPFMLLMRAPAGMSFADAAGPVLALVVGLALVLYVAAKSFEAGVSYRLSFAQLKARLAKRRR